MALTDGSHAFKGPSGAAMMRVVFEIAKAKKALKVPCTTWAAAEAYLKNWFGPLTVLECGEPVLNPELGVSLSLADRQAMIKDRKATAGMASWLAEKAEEVLHGDGLAAGIAPAAKGVKRKSR